MRKFFRILCALPLAKPRDHPFEAFEQLQAAVVEFLQRRGLLARRLPRRGPFRVVFHAGDAQGGEELRIEIGPVATIGVRLVHVGFELGEQRIQQAS
jgi:hypothetical protein